MKTNLLILICFLPLSFLNANATFQANSECKECHPTIYKEHQGTMHNNATIFKDPIHKAVWDKHPANLKKGKYKCAKCHTPTANNLEKMLGKGTKSVPDISNPTHTEGISCAYCHRIQSIKPSLMANENIINKEEKDYFGTMKSPVRNKFHYTAANDNFRTGQVCMGCHSHKKNKQEFDVCSTGMATAGDENNCITCHMPKVAGSVSTKEDGESHSYHGFPGANSGQEMLAKYIDIHFTNKSEGFEISIYNQSPHEMLLHPLRLAQLRVSIVQGSKTIDLKPEVFVKVIGTKGKASPPWRATQVVKNTMIKAKETRLVTYENELKAGDTLKVTLGYFLVKPKMLVKFALENNEKVKKFHILKEVLFQVK